MAALWSVSFSISTDTVKPLAVECRLDKYNFSIVLVILPQEHIFFMVYIEILHLTWQIFVLHLSMCVFDDQRKYKAHAGDPRISSNTSISPV